MRDFKKAMEKDMPKENGVQLEMTGI